MLWPLKGYIPILPFFRQSVASLAMKYVVLCTLTLMVMAGCASSQNNRALRVHPQTGRMEKPLDAPVEVFKAAPDKPFDELGMTESVYQDADPAKGLANLKKYARRMGGDAIILHPSTSDTVMGGLIRRTMHAQVIAWKAPSSAPATNPAP